MITKLKTILLILSLPTYIIAQNLNLSVQPFLSIAQKQIPYNPNDRFEIRKDLGVRLNADYNFYKNFSLKAGFSYLSGDLRTYHSSIDFTGMLKEYSFDLGIIWEMSSVAITPMIGAGATYYFYDRSVNQPSLLSGFHDPKENIDHAISPFVMLGVKSDLFNNVFYIIELRYTYARFNMNRTFIVDYNNEKHSTSYEESFNRLFYGLGIGITL